MTGPGRRTLKRSWTMPGGTTAVILLIAITSAIAAGAVVADDLKLPGFLSADEQRPVDAPKEGQEVSVLQVVLRADGDKVTGEIRSQEIVQSVPPKSKARSAGDWEVRVHGDKEFSYRIPNPLLDVEAENPEDQESPYTSVQTDTLDWTLIVPLYDQGEPLGAKSIEVFDLLNDKLILETEVGDQSKE